MTKLQELKQKQSELRKQIKEASQVFFKYATKDLFTQHPKLESFRWTQYTPYFNDGDECTFSVHKDDLDFVFDGAEVEDVSTWTINHEKYGKDYVPEFKAAALQAFDLMGQMDDEVLKQLFGDHVEVICTKDGAEASSYSHD